MHDGKKHVFQLSESESVYKKSIAQAFHCAKVREISLAWLSPFSTVKEMAKIIITMLTSEGGRKQITNSICTPAMTSTSIDGQIEKKTYQQDLCKSARKEKKDSYENEVSRQEGADVIVTNIRKTLAE